MPLPTLSDVHVSQPLSNLSVAYVQDKNKFKANKLAPLVPVNKQTNSYFTFSKADFNRDEVKVRSPGTGFARTGYNLSTASYTCIQYGLEHALPDEIRANFDSPLNAERAAIAQLMNKFLIKRERIFASTFMTTSVWGRDVTGHGSTENDTNTVYWDNASADIPNAIHKQCDYVEGLTGFRPNRFVTSPQVWRVMHNDPDIIDRHKHTSGEPISMKAVANLCGIGSEEDPGEIVVLNAAYNSAAENVTASMGFMIDDDALLMYVPPSPQLEQPSAVYTFSWSEFDFIKDGAAGISTYRDEPNKSDIFRGEMYFDMKVVATDCAVFFDNLLT